MKIPSKYQKLAAIAITICLVAMITIVLGQGFQDSIPEVVWTMVNVNHAEQQGDAHLI